MTKTQLIKLLKSCSKAELTEIILKASELTYPTFPWKHIIVAEIRTETIEKKIDANLEELEVLKKKFEAIPEEKRIIGNDEALNLRIEISKKSLEFRRLNKQRKKIEKELHE